MEHTAIDWYIDLMNKYFEEGAVQCGLGKDGKIYQQAKQMEKQQIIDAWFNCYLSIIDENTKTANEYYEETFNKPKQ
jgi:hypothetical protein